MAGLNALYDWVRRIGAVAPDPAPTAEIAEAARPARMVAGGPAMPILTPRRGFEYGIPTGGINDRRTGATLNDRTSLMQQLYEAYLACPWAWAAVNAIARSITAGGVQAEWDGDDGDGDKKAPPKPASVLAMERLFDYCNDREDINQLMRGVITDLVVFGDAFVEVVWIGNIPVALYSLDSPSMFPVADEHGVISGYRQVTEYGQRAEFEPREVIHISMDSPRSGVFGVSQTQAALLPVTAWLFAAATAKEIFRKGNPPNIHVDMPAGTSETEINRWDAQYAARNVGPRNIGTPVITKGGGIVNELQRGQLKDYLEFLDQKRDEILATYGVPPAEAGVIESGHLGSGTGESQRKTFETNTCQPTAAIVMEKFNFHLGLQGFGIEGWHFRFGSVDMRDSKTIEDIRDLRIRNGTYTLNKARTEINEPPAEGGDDPILVDRTGMVLWKDLPAMSQATVAAAAAPGGLEPEEPKDGKAVRLIKPEPEPVPPALAAGAGVPPVPGQPPVVPVPAAPGAKDAAQGGGKVIPFGKKAKKAAGKKAGKPAVGETDAEWRQLAEQWTALYLERREQALAELPPVVELVVDEHAAADGDDHADHDHHNGPHYRAADLGVDELTTINVNPRTVQVDHENYQRDLVPGKVASIVKHGKGALRNRLGLLARRDDGSLWCVDGQHHTAAAVKLKIKTMPYQVFDSTGPAMEARVFDAWQRWDKADNPGVRAKQLTTSGK